MLRNMAKSIFPKYYANRLRAEKEIELLEKSVVTNSGYNQRGADVAGWITTNDSPDNDIIENLEELRARSRDLYQTNDIAVSVMDKYRTKVVGIGLMPKPTIDYKTLGITKEKAKEYEYLISAKFEAWAMSSNCDSTRVHDFFTMQALAQLSWIMNGDVFAIIKRKPTREIDIELCIQLLESDRVVSPQGNDEIKGGVEFKNDELYKYYISNKHPGDGDVDIRGYPVFNSLGRRNILHIFEPNRVGQKRGTPLLAPVLKSYKQLDRYKNAELAAAVINASVAMILKSSNPSNTLNMGHIKKASGMKEDISSNANYNSIKKEMSATFGQGALFSTDGSEELKEFQTNRPNKSYKDFVEKIIEEIGAASGIPAEVMMGAFKSSYSAAKAALEEAESRFKVCRKLLERKFCHPIYEEFIIELIKNGDVECPGFFENVTIRNSFSKCLWIGVGKPSLDPLKDAKAAEILIKNKIIPRSVLVRQMGLDWDSIRESIEQEEKDMAVATSEVNGILKKGGDKK